MAFEIFKNYFANRSNGANQQNIAATSVPKFGYTPLIPVPNFVSGKPTVPPLNRYVPTSDLGIGQDVGKVGGLSVPNFMSPSTPFTPQPAPQIVPGPSGMPQLPPISGVPTQPAPSGAAAPQPEKAQIAPAPSPVAAPITAGPTTGGATSGGTGQSPSSFGVSPELAKSISDAESKVAEANKVSPEELSTQADLDNLRESLKKGYLDAAGKPIPMEFITGQQKAIEQRAAMLAEPLDRKLARMQAARTASLEASKFALERADKAAEVARKEWEFTHPQKSNEPYTLSPGETRYDANGRIIATGGPKPLSQAAEAKTLENADKATAAQQQAAQSIGLVNDLLNSDTASITGLGQNPLNYIFGGAASGNAENLNKYNQLQGMLKLGVRGLLKGQGAVSDYEGRILGQAASALGRNLPNEAFKEALQKIRGVLKTNQGQSTSVTVTNPQGKQITTDLTGPEIYKLVSEGNTIKYQ